MAVTSRRPSSPGLVAGELLGSVPRRCAPGPARRGTCARPAMCLKLRIEPVDKTLALDLRTDLDRARSAFLHQLTALGISWGTVTEDLVKGTGTWHETWSLRWRPELAVDIIDAAVWGTTVPMPDRAIIDVVASAADLSGRHRRSGASAGRGTADALAPVLRALDAQAAADSDVADLMSAVPPRRRRPGTAPSAAPHRVAGGRDQRADASGPALASRPPRAASRTTPPLRCARPSTACTPHWRGPSAPVTPRASPGADEAVAGGARLRGQPTGCARADRGPGHPAAADAGVVPWAQAAVRLRAALSVGVTAMGKAAWAEGFLSGGGLLLVHDRDLLDVLDGWVASLDEDDFLDVLPLLRRTFGEFSAPERAAIGAAAGQLSGSGGAGAGDPGAAADDIDASRAAGALATVALILGGA